jgi:hypothetical protein
MDVAVANVPDIVLPVAADAANPLSSQLSDMTYSQSFEQVGTMSKRFSVPQFSKLPTIETPDAMEAVSKVKEFAMHSTESVNHALAEAKEAGSSQLSHLFGSVGHSFDGISGKVASVGSSSVDSIRSAVDKLDKVKITGLSSKIPSLDMSKVPNLDFSKVKMPSAPQMPSLDMSKVKIPTMPVAAKDSSAAPVTHVNFADSSLSDIGNSILGSMKFLGGIIFQFLDWVIGAVAGTSLSNIFGSVQTSISTLIENASTSVVNMLNGLGNLTLKEILQSFLTLILVVTDMILKVTNAIVYLISGKDAGDWVLEANFAIHTHGDRLLAQAGAAYQDVTHKSLGELAISIEDYSHHVGEELLAVMNSLSTQTGMENLLNGAGGDVTYLSADNLDTIVSAVQTALTL